MTVKYLRSLRIAALMAIGTTVLHAPPAAKAAASDMAKTAPVPRECNQADLSAYGKPTFAMRLKSPLAGISLAKHQFRAGEPIVIHIWINNSHGESTNVWSCGASPFIWVRKHNSVVLSRKHNSDIGLEHFQWKGFDLYNDATGQRVLNKYQQKALSNGSTLKELCSTDKDRFKMQGVLMQCLRNVPIPIPAHTCLTKNDSDFTFDLLDRYDLPAGRYTIRFRNDKSDADDICRTMNQPPWHGPEDPNLTFSVVQPRK